MLKNRKILCAFILIILVITLSSIIYVRGRKDIPKLTVTYNGKNVEVGQGPYKWKSRGKLKEYTLDTYSKVLCKLLPEIKVSPNGQLKLHFDYQPKSITLSGSSETDGKVIKNNVINIADYNTGIYFLDCKWKEGLVIYVIYVDIGDWKTGDEIENINK
ncbi:hypothetical protein ACFIJ5_18195 (plasmid) [Haloimpatiens sp. FM7330]|uniref:hypothetical protein n=1 Tax=Haloimpatiens sp. FM7330 TaxID=3298610 RepID=UPI003625EE17